MQYNLFDPQLCDKLGLLPLQDADVSYFPYFLSQQQADEYLVCLQSTLAWQQEHIKLYGKSVKIPRLQAWYGDSDARYQYSGLSLEPNPWTKALAELRLRCEDHCGHRFNSVLANCYRDGQDSMGWHADNESELGPRPVIASLSFGQVRNFDLRHRKSGAKYRLALEHGSLLLMAGDTQQYWQHGLAKTKKDVQARINLTFRRVYPAKLGGH